MAFKKKYGPGHPLYEYHKRRKAGKTTRKRAKRTKTKVNRGYTMARRKTRRRTTRGSGNILSGKGMLGAKIGFGMLGSAGAGLIASELSKRFMPGNDVVRGGLGLLLGGPIGAATAYVAKDGVNTLTGMLGKGTGAGSGTTIYS